MVSDFLFYSLYKESLVLTNIFSLKMYAYNLAQQSVWLVICIAVKEYGLDLHSDHLQGQTSVKK